MYYETILRRDRIKRNAERHREMKKLREENKNLVSVIEEAINLLEIAHMPYEIEAIRHKLITNIAYHKLSNRREL